MDNKKKGFLVLGIGTLATIPVILASKKAKAAPPSGEPVVGLGVKNPPAGAQFWSVYLCDWDFKVAINPRDGGDKITISQPAFFDIPEGIAMPLRFISLQITKWNYNETALEQLYYMQSYRPYLWDFDLGDWSSEQDPTYRDIFIEQYGDFYLNVANQKLESA